MVPFWYLCATADRRGLVYSERCHFLPRGDGHPATIIGDKQWAFTEKTVVAVLPRLELWKTQLLPCSLSLVRGI